MVSRGGVSYLGEASKTQSHPYEDGQKQVRDSDDAHEFDHVVPEDKRTSVVVCKYALELVTKIDDDT